MSAMANAFAADGVLVAAAPYLRFGCTLLGAIAAYALLPADQNTAIMKAIKRLFPAKSKLWKEWALFVAVVLAGSVIGSITFDSTTPFQAFAAGFSWSGSLSALQRAPLGSSSRGPDAGPNTITTSPPAMDAARKKDVRNAERE